MFEVSPWEVETDDYEFELVHSVERDGEEWELALRRRPNSNAQFAFRQLNGPLLVGYHTFSKNDPPPAEDEVFRIFTRVDEYAQWSRILYLNEKLLLRREGEECRYQVDFQPKGEGYFSRKGSFLLGAFAGFRWGVNASQFLITSSTKELIDRLDQEADSAFARRYLFMSEDEIWREVWRWKRGNQSELKRILELALLAQKELWQTETNLWLTLDVFAVDSEANLGVVLYSDQFAIHDVDDPRPLPLALREGLKTALAHFAPTVNSKHVEKYMCLRQLLNDDIWRIEIKPQNPTAHERIEAALAWREWLAQTQSQ